MNRGSQKLTTVFPLAYEVNKKRTKNVASVERDKCLTFRFFYYYHITEKRFDSAISEMEKEFYISSRYIVDRLTDNDGLLKEIIAKNPNRSQLKKLYPHLNWN